jgi:hypothetical protein
VGTAWVLYVEGQEDTVDPGGSMAQVASPPD